MLQGHTFTWQFVKENESDQWEIGQKPVYNNKNNYKSPGIIIPRLDRNLKNPQVVILQPNGEIQSPDMQIFRCQFV